MKVFRLVDIPDLKSPVAANEFTALNKYERPNSIVMKFDERFPVNIQMPPHPKNLYENPRISGPKASLADLTWTDWQLIHFAAEQSLKKDLINRADQRRSNDYEQINRLANKAVSDELVRAQFRTFMTWISRFKMERMFEELGIRTIEDFKRQMSVFHTQADESHRVFVNLLLRQLGMGPTQIPTPALAMKLDGKDDLIIRMKIENERVRLIDFSEARLRMAQIQAATNIAQQLASPQRIMNAPEQQPISASHANRKVRGVS